MNRLPPVVVCESCAEPKRLREARRLVTCWARAGSAGTLSGLANLTTHDRWRCDACLRLELVGGQTELAL